MKDYDEVVKSRYDRDDFSSSGILRNQYSIINNIGSRGFHKKFDVLRTFIKEIIVYSNKSFDGFSLCDCGCGTGSISRMCAEILGTPKNVCGFEFSQNRLNYCKSMNNNIDYRFGNIVNDFPFSNTFDALLCFDVLSHIRKESDIVDSLKNLYNHTNVGGGLLWFEINAKTHFTNYDADTQGYSKQEMNHFAESVGFKEIKFYGMFKRFKIFNKEYQTYYLANKFSTTVLDVIEKIIPGEHTTNIGFYIKQ